MDISKVINFLPIIVLFGLLVSCEPVTPQKSTINKRLVFDNYDYENTVGYSRIISGSTNGVNELANPVMVLGQKAQLMLDFDLMVENSEFLNATLIHCNKDWSQSQLQDLDFISGINNFRINEFDNSINTIYKYVNYRFPLPTPTKSGNYLVVVHRRGNPKDYILSRKFTVVENISIINTMVKQSTTVSKRRKNQQVEVTINYGKLLVNRPFEDISIALIQNQNWNTLKTNIAPTLVRPNENYLEYRPVNLDLNFSGWNEFRFFDLRTIEVPGRNVRGTVRNENTIKTTLIIDENKTFKPYSLDLRDINGRFLISNTDIGQLQLGAEYSNVLFTLEAPRISGNVYVTGQLTDWKINDRYRMTYNEPLKSYQTELFLKQGYYEYQYHVAADTLPAYHFEGSHFETENEYELFVYYRQPGTINDRIIGYRKFGSITN